MWMTMCKTIHEMASGLLLRESVELLLQPARLSWAKENSSLLLLNLLKSVKCNMCAITFSLSSTQGSNLVRKRFLHISLMAYRVECFFPTSAVNFILASHILNFVLFNRNSKPVGVFLYFSFQPKSQNCILESSIIIALTCPSVACRRYPNKKQGFMFCVLLI